MSGSRVIRSDDVPWEEGHQGDLFSHRRRRLAHAAGGRGLGCSLIELDPGRTAWPFHYHCGAEEAIYVLAGEGTLRLGGERRRVVAGDYVALPPGPDHAHQLTNTSADVLRYLVMSTMVAPDVCVYPDSGKVGVVAALRDEDGATRRVVTYPLAAEVGYWEGETTSVDGAGNPPPRPSAQVRQAELDARVEADLQALRDRLEHGGSPTPPRPRAPSPPEPEPAVDPVEADLEALKRKLGRSTATATTEADDDLDALKRVLDDDGA